MILHKVRRLIDESLTRYMMPLRGNHRNYGGRQLEADETWIRGLSVAVNMPSLIPPGNYLTGKSRMDDG